MAEARRREDDRLLRGAGHFVDDVDRPGQLWMRVVRSSAAHARLVAVETERARELPGVHAVLSAADLPDLPPIPLRLGPFEEDFDPYLQPPLAREACATSASRSPSSAPRTRTWPRTPRSSWASSTRSSSRCSTRSPARPECTVLRRGFGDVDGAFAARRARRLARGQGRPPQRGAAGDARPRRRAPPGRGQLHRLGHDEGPALQPPLPRRRARRAGGARVDPALGRRRRLRRARGALPRGPARAVPRARGSGGRSSGSRTARSTSSPPTTRASSCTASRPPSTRSTACSRCATSSGTTTAPTCARTGSSCRS